MLIGIGTDIIEIYRVAKAMENRRFMERCFARGEIAVIDGVIRAERRNEIAAGYFAAKEAASKAIGTGFRGFSPCDIEVVKDCLGAPSLLLHNGAKTAAGLRGIAKIFVSISHSGGYAVAFAVAEGD